MSAFGTLQSQEAGGQSLTGMIASKMSQSRKKAKAKDKKESKKTETTDSSQQTDNKPKESSSSPKNTKKSLFGNPFSKLKEKLSFNKKGKPNASREREIGGNATGKTPGLVKLLTKGFGVLATDTTQIQGNLSQITEALQRQLGIQDYTSNSVVGVQSILSDQLENQTAIIEALGGTVPSRGGGATGGPSAFGSSTSEKADGKSLAGFINEQIQSALKSLGLGAGGGILSRFLPSLLNPVGAFVGLASIMGGLTIWGQQKQKESIAGMYGPERIEKAKKELEAARKAYKQKPNFENMRKLQEKLNWYNEYSGNNATDPAKLNPSFVGSSGGIASYSSGGMNKYAAGQSSMIGEAGKERVVDLHSRDAKNTNGDSTAAMQATGGSLLSVVNEFMKAMGPLGGPVSQAVGPQAAALAKDFDMSGGLLNFRMQGGLFKDNNDNKKKRDNFMKELVTDSLKALGAKGKEKPKPRTGPAPTGTGDPNQSRAEERNQQTETSMGNIPGQGAPMERAAPEGITPRPGEVAYASEKPIAGTQVKMATGDRMMVPAADKNPVVGTGGKFWYDNQGKIYRWRPGHKLVQYFADELRGQLKADSMDFLRDMNTGVVRRTDTRGDMNPFNNNSIKTGEFSYQAMDLLEGRDKNNKPIWRKKDKKGDIEGIYGPQVEIPKQSNLTSFDSGGQVVTVNGERIQVDKNGYPSEDGYFNPFGYGSGIPNPFVSDKRRQALSVQREAARRNSPMYRGMEVLSGKRLITGGTTDQLKEYGYADGGGMIGPSWMPWNWGKLVDNQRNTNKGLGYNAKYSDVTDPEMRRMMGLPPLKGYESGGKAEGGLSGLLKWLSTPMFQGASKPAVRGLQNSASSGQLGGVTKKLADERRMYEELGIAKPYEKGGSAFGTMQAQGYAANPQISAIEDTLKVLTIKMSRMEQPRSIPAAPTAPVGVVNESANQEGGMIINNIIAASGGGGGGMAASPNDSYRTADTASSPDPSGTASLLNRSPYAVYR